MTATGTPVVTLTGVPGTQVAFVWSGTSGTIEAKPVTTGNTYVAVKLAAGWALYQAGGSSAPTLTQVTPIVPVFADDVSTITLADQAGVNWKVDGTATSPGVVHVTPPVTVTVTAVALSGYELVGTTSWTHDFPVPASPPTPPDQIADLVGWYDPSDSTKVTLDGSSRVESIANNVASGPAISQSTAAARPFTTTANGLAALKSDRATTGGGFLLTTGSVIPSMSVGTTFAISRADTADESAWNYVVGDDGNTQLGYSHSATKIINQGSPVMQVTGLAADRLYFIVVTQDAALTRTIYVDGVAQANTSQSSALTVARFGLFAGGSWANAATVGDSGIYSRALSASEVKALYLWAKQKWGLP